MKKLIMMVAALAACGMVAGCFTSATARTKRTNVDGSITESTVKIVGTGDKASQIAAEGLFADGDPDNLGAGVNKANASQTSTGIDGTLKGMGEMMSGIAQLAIALQGVQSPAVVSGVAPASSSASVNGSYTPTMTDIIQGANGSSSAEVSAATSIAPQIIAGDGVRVVILGNKSTCSLCRSLWAGINAPELSAALGGATIIDADAASNASVYAQYKPQGSILYPLITVYNGANLVGQFSGRGMTQASLISKVSSLLPKTTK